MATLHGMTYEEIVENWADETSCKTINKPRRFNVHVTAIDQSEQALAYGKEVGLYDNLIQCDLNNPTEEVKAQLNAAISQADILQCTATLNYLESDAIERIMNAFADGREG